MNNLEAKQEAIKNAYSEYWENVKDYVDGNGWIKCKDIHYHKDLGLMRDQIHYIDNGKEWDNFEIISWRIPILQGIENNNGWIRIESEDDLPKEVTNCFIITNGEMYATKFYPKNFKGWINVFTLDHVVGLGYKSVTHYQPIEKPKLPIY